MPEALRAIAEQKMGTFTCPYSRCVTTYIRFYKTASLHHLWNCRRLLLRCLYQDDSKEAGNVWEIVTYEGQGHGFFNRGEHYDLSLAVADTFLSTVDGSSQKKIRRDFHNALRIK